MRSPRVERAVLQGMRANPEEPLRVCVASASGEVVLERTPIRAEAGYGGAIWVPQAAGAAAIQSDAPFTAR